MIEEETDYSFFYNSKELKLDQTISIDFKGNSINEVLDKVFKGIKIVYSIQGSQILLIPKDKEGTETLQQTVSGRVADEENLPLPGVSIVIKGTSHGVVTDINGNYLIANVPANAVLVFSFIGMKTLEVAVTNQTTINVKMEEVTIGIDEVIAIGYGSIKKGELTGAVSSVKGDMLENIPAARVEQMLQGRVAGIQVTQVDGSPGAASLIRVRGGNSIQGDNDPLYVVDGYIMGIGYNLNNINTSDIQSIEVLKDATAIAVYGTRGSNGVVLITTKTGKDIFKPLVTFNAYHGTQQMINYIELLDGQQHAEWANEAYEFVGNPPSFTDIENVPNTNWIKAITRDAPVSNVDLSIAGQSPNSKSDYYVSANYFNQEGIIKNSGFNRYSFNSKLNIELSEKVNVGFKLNASRSFIENNKVNFSNVLIQGLTSKAIYDEDGNYTALNPVSGSVQRNPVADVELKVDHSIRTNLFGNFFIEYELFHGLTLRSTIGPELNFYKTNVYNPSTLPDNSYTNAGGDGSVSQSNRFDILNENTVTYVKEMGNHRLNMLGGFTWQKQQTESLASSAYGFSNDATTYNNLSLGSDPLRNVVGSGWNDHKLVSWLARANYTYKNKYMFTLVGRVDGSSKFATTKNKYAFFPSAGVAWRLDHEPFIQNLNVFDLIKLRASYGSSGSQAIGSYRTLSVLNGTNVDFNDLPVTAVVSGRPANEDLKWETTDQLDLGIDLAILNNRLSFEVDYYQKVTKDLLLNVEIPYQTGYTSKLQNLGKISNKGLELTFNSTNISRKNFKWLSTLIISGNRSKVLDLAGSEFIDLESPISGGVSSRLIVGQPAPVFVGVEYLGTWNSQEEIDASKQTGQFVGGPHFKDVNEDGFIDLQDFGIIGNPQPDFIGSLNNTFIWKNFELDIYLQGTYGNDVFNTFTQQAYFGRPEGNKYAELADRWTQDNPTSDIPRAGTILTLATARSNTVNIEDGSHLRLKNLRFTYNLPVKKLGLDKFQSLSVYFSGSNLFLLSNFRLGDPEVNRYGTDNVVYGYASGEYPHARTLTFGVKASF
ncbi:TonB-dependent receptor [Mariniphaga anaerophila]|nr:TonB-dependent receptor [Mariniphaga anaerophila]